jgi:hypothetical protein
LDRFVFINPDISLVDVIVVAGSCLMKVVKKAHERGSHGIGLRLLKGEKIADDGHAKGVLGHGLFA